MLTIERSLLGGTPKKDYTPRHKVEQEGFPKDVFCLKYNYIENKYLYGQTVSITNNFGLVVFDSESEANRFISDNDTSIGKDKLSELLVIEKLTLDEAKTLALSLSNPELYYLILLGSDPQEIKIR